MAKNSSLNVASSASPTPKKKLTIAQLQEKLEAQEETINKLQEELCRKDEKITKLESKISKLEGQVAINTSIQFVRDRVTEELKNQMVNLQQYTRRYSVVISGLKRNTDEKEEIKEVLKEAASTTSFDDVDKFHRVGPIKDNNKQDLIIRFKSHSAKESFFLNRKKIKRNNIKVKPSLAPGRKALLEEATEVVKEYAESNLNLKNRPHFAYSDMHGNLKVKMSHEVNNKLFFKFSSINDLCSIIETNQEVREEGGEVDLADEVNAE